MFKVNFEIYINISKFVIEFSSPTAFIHSVNFLYDGRYDYWQFMNGMNGGHLRSFDRS